MRAAGQRLPHHPRLHEAHPGLCTQALTQRARPSLTPPRGRATSDGGSRGCEHWLRALAVCGEPGESRRPRGAAAAEPGKPGLLLPCRAQKSPITRPSQGRVAAGGETGSAPRYVNNLNNTDEHKGAIIRHCSRDTPPSPTTQREAAFLHALKVAVKPRKNGDKHPVCTLEFKGSLE